MESTKDDKLITSADIKRMQEVGMQFVDNKIVFKKLVNESLDKQIYITGYNWLDHSVDALVLTQAGKSTKRILISDLENEQGLKCAQGFKESNLYALELFPDGSEMLHDLYLWFKERNSDKEEVKHLEEDIEEDEEIILDEKLIEEQEMEFQKLHDLHYYDLEDDNDITK